MKTKRKGKRGLWITLAVVAVLVVVGLGGYAVMRRRVQAASAPQPGDVVAAFIGDLSASASASGTLLPKQEAQLALGVAGVVEQVYVRVGDEVRAGDTLVQLESDDLERAVESARQALAIQQANLAGLLKAPDAQDVAATQAAVDSAQATLDDLLAGPSDEELAQAQTAVDSAQTTLDDLRAGPSDEELVQARAAVASAQAALRAAQARYEALDDQLVVAQNDIDNAQLAMDSARDMYNLLVWNNWQAADSWAPYSPQGAAVKNAKINYDVAVANYALAKLNVNDAGIRGAQAQLAQAQAALAALTEDKSVQIAAAEARLARAQVNLTTLTGDKSVEIAAAETRLAQAQATLAKLLDGASQEQIAIAQARVEQAQVSLEEAQANLANATLVAPFDGTITDVYIAVGERANGPAVELVAANSLQVVLDVDEIDIGGIKVGQQTLVTLETWPDRELAATVVSISPQAKTIAGIVTFEVRLSLDAGDLPLRTGMTANADLITAQREKTLLVPNRAIIADRQAAKYYVNKVVGEEVSRVEVTVGLRDHLYTEITSGLEKGDRVYIGQIDQGFSFRDGPPKGARKMRQ